MMLYNLEIPVFLFIPIHLKSWDFRSYKINQRRWKSSIQSHFILKYIQTVWFFNYFFCKIKTYCQNKVVFTQKQKWWKMKLNIQSVVRFLECFETLHNFSTFGSTSLLWNDRMSQNFFFFFFFLKRFLTPALSKFHV